MDEIIPVRLVSCSNPISATAPCISSDTVDIQGTDGTGVGTGSGGSGSGSGGSGSYTVIPWSKSTRILS